MRTLNISLPEARSVKINGQAFEIKVADVGIMERAIKMQEYSKIKSGDDQKIIKAIRETIAFIDEMLGEGATNKIAEGRPVNLSWAIETMQTIALEIVKEYQSEVVEEYE